MSERATQSMEPETLAALLASIEHWERLAAGVEGEIPGADSCALCWRFNTAIGCFCDLGPGEELCPVRAATGLELCEGTPYLAAYAAWVAGGRRSSTAFREAAAVEVAFLRSLVPGAVTVNKEVAI